MMVALLLEAGARIDAVGPDLSTPLQLAVRGGRREVVELLLAKGANTEWRDASGCAALHDAAQLKAKDIASLLLEHGADVDIGSTGGSNYGTTALMASANLGDLDMIKLLLGHGAQIEQADRTGRTALIVAAMAGWVDAAKLLLERHAKLEATDQEGGTAFMMAAKVGQLEIVKFLLKSGARIAATNGFGFTALHEAADRGHVQVVEFLLNSGMKVDPRSDGEQLTPLHIAAIGWFTNEVHYVNIARALLNYGAKVNARMRGDRTPLHCAAIRGHPQIIQVLLKAGADPSELDGDGKTALDLATDTRALGWLRPGAPAGRKECADLLRDYHQVPTPDAKIQKLPQSTNPPAGERKP